MSTPLTPRKRLQLHLDVADEAQAAELTAAWQEIISGKKPRLTTAAEDAEAIMERARPALQRIVKAIEDHPRSGQTHRLVGFLAGLYNGVDFPFDLTDLRTLDADLANACIDYLNYDRLGKAELHTHLPGRGRRMLQFLAEQGIRPQPHLSETDGHQARLAAVAERLGRERDQLIREALEDLLSRYEGQAFGALRATQSSQDADPPLVHACLLSAPAAQPLCGAGDGPWSARPFEFLRLTCRECVGLALDPNDDAP